MKATTTAALGGLGGLVLLGLYCGRARGPLPSVPVVAPVAAAPNAPASSLASTDASTQRTAADHDEPALDAPRHVYRGQLRVHPDARSVIVPHFGTIEWRIVAADDTESNAQSDVEKGQWSLEAAADDHVEITGIYVDGRKATPRVREFVAAALEGTLLDADWASGPRLHVLDRETRVELQGVKLAACPRSLPFPYDCPSPEESSTRLLEGADSPIALPDTGGSELAWVCARDHAWKLVSYVGSEGERTILLDRAASLVCNYRELPFGGENQVLRLDRADGARTVPLARCFVRQAGQLTLEGLPACEVHVRIGTEKSDGTVRPFLFRSIRLAAGERATLELDGSTRSIPADDGRLRVTLHALDGNPCRVTEALLLAGETQRRNPAGVLVMPAQPADSALAFEAPSLSPGKYTLTFMPLGFSTEIVVRAGELTALEFDAPPTFPLRVQVVDAKTGDPLSSPLCILRPRGPESSYTGIAARPVAPDSACVFECPAGEFTLVASASGFRSEQRVLQVAAGAQLATIGLHRRPGDYRVTLRLRSSGAAIPVGSEFWSATRLEALDGQGQVISMGLTRMGMQMGAGTADATFAVDDAGRYRVHFPTDFEVVVENETTIEVGPEFSTTVVIAATERR